MRGAGGGFQDVGGACGEDAPGDCPEREGNEGGELSISRRKFMAMAGGVAAAPNVAPEAVPAAIENQQKNFNHEALKEVMWQIYNSRFINDLTAHRKKMLKK